MKRSIRISLIVALLGLILAGAAVHRYPYTVRYVISVIVPSRHVSYGKNDLTYLNTFNDRQSRQMKAARKVGLPEVPASREDVNSILDQLEKVKNCRAYSLAPMGHSVPYLRPNAKAALDQIGNAFRDSLKSKGLPEYRIVVTSILRTKADVERLQKSNTNATSNSCHCYATTFDISYAQFERITPGAPLSNAELKAVLGEVLLEQRRAGKIYVKYELGQPCFHITSRK